MAICCRLDIASRSNLLIVFFRICNVSDIYAMWDWIKKRIKNLFKLTPEEKRL